MAPKKTFTCGSASCTSPGSGSRSGPGPAAAADDLPTSLQPRSATGDSCSIRSSLYCLEEGRSKSRCIACLAAFVAAIAIAIVFETALETALENASEEASEAAFAPVTRYSDSALTSVSLALLTAWYLSNSYSLPYHTHAG